MKRLSLVILASVVLLLLGGCFSKEVDTTQKAVVEGNNSEITSIEQHLDLTIASTVDAEQSVIDLYNNWQGNLICDNRSYSSNDTIYYSEQPVDCAIQLEFMDKLNVTSQQLKSLQEQFISSDDYWQGVQFVNLMTNAMTPNIISFQLNPPEQPLTLLFSNAQQEAIFSYHFQRVEPFSFEVTTPFQVNSDSIEVGARHYVRGEQTHHFSISFSEAVNKALTEQQLDNLLGELRKKIKWSSDRNLHLTLYLEESDNLLPYEEYVFYFDASITESKQEVYANPIYYRFQPTALKHYRVVDPMQQKQDIMFSSLIAYTALNVSPYGKWILAEELSSRESILVPIYSLLNREGERVKQLAMDSPQWLPDGNTLLYKNQNAIVHYNVLTGEETRIWEDEEEASASLSFQIDRYSGNLIIAAGHYDEHSKLAINLYHYENINDEHPIVLNKLFNDELGMHWDGLHYQVPVYDLGRGYIYYEHDTDEQAIEHYVINVDSKQAILLELEEHEHVFPSRQGKLLLLQDSKLKLYDAAKQTEHELQLKFNEGSQLQVRAAGENQMLLIITDEESTNNYLVDVNTYQIKKYAIEGAIILSRIWDGVATVSH